MKPFQFRKIALVLSLLISLASATSAQSRSAEEREAEWNAYALPSSAFSRQTDSAKSIVFRVPVDWKQQGQLSFNGPEGSQLRIIIEDIPDGIPLKAYLAALLKGLHDIPGGPDALTIRRANLSGVEAREVSFELSDVRGTVIRRVIWMAVDGPKAVTFFFSVPVARASQVEPFFKATVLSTLFLRSVLYNEEFELMRQSRFPQSGPARIDETLSLIPALDGVDESSRSKAIASLASIFSSSPDQAIDLLIDRRPMVRAAVIDAMEKSRNPALTDFILQAIVDKEAYVSNHAALALARQQDPVALLRRRFGNWAIYDYPYFLRATSMLDKKSRIQIASELLKAPKTPPPPEIRIPAGKPPKPPSDKLKRPSAGRIPGGGPVGFVAAIAPDLNLRFLALNLLDDVAASEFSIPLADVVAAKEDSFTVAALQLALNRREALPINELLTLLSHADETIGLLAADCLALSAQPADIPRIEAVIEKLSPPAKDSPTTISGGFRKSVTDEVKLSIEKIRLRERFSNSDSASRRSLIDEAMKDTRLANWAWIELARDEIEGRRKPHDTPVSSSLRISPMGENLFPANVQFYTALPNPAATLSNLAESFNNIHMDSARGQATMALMISSFKEHFAQFFGLESSRQGLEYLGIDMTAPWAMASWTAEGAPVGLKSAQRKAVILKISDRDRFERVLALYQQRLGNFSSFPEYLSIGSRAIGFVPAMLPLVGSLAGGSPTPRPFAPLRYDLMREEECLGHRVKVIERREVGFMGRIRNDSAYLVYINDRALIASDWYALRDALTRLSAGGPAIGASPQFKRAMQEKGDVIYLSNIGNLLSPADKTTRVVESGALTISNAAWENTFRISLDDKEWMKKLRPFQTSDLLAPKRLLPRSSFVYIFLKPDLAAMAKDAKSPLFSDIDIKQIVAAFAPEIQLQVLSEIEGEAGAALLSFPSFGKGFDAPWVFFFRLKGEKTSEAFANGKLFKGVPEPSKPARIKMGKREIIAAVKNGFLVFVGSEETLAILDAGEKLDVARDFAKAAQKAPPNVITFGGYNLEAAISFFANLSKDPETRQLGDAFSSMIRAFHSQNFYALATDSGIEARMSVSMDREGRYSVSELPMLAKEFDFNFAVMEAGGIPIADQSRLERLKLKIKAKGEGSAAQVREDITNDHQSVEQAGGDLIVTIRPRQTAPSEKIQLPVSGAQFAPFLSPSPGINSADASVIAQAREIAGADRDAWSVAQKLSDWTYKNLKWKRVDSADAVQTLATREADCVEFSELFIAMARSLGLPARMVSGIAYGDSSFGAHAWVEVYAGRWIELDPTFGTNFVDATHIRSKSDDLIRYAALNLLDIEVIEAPRSTPDYQRDAGRLAETICKEISEGSDSALSLSLDMSVVVDAQMGAGAWERASAAERDKLLAAHRRLVSEIEGSLLEDHTSGSLRLLSVKVSGERAEAYTLGSRYFDESLIRLDFIRRGDVWMLVEAMEMDRDLGIVNEVMRPTLESMMEKRNGKTVRGAMSPYLRALSALSEDAKVALEVIDKSLAEDPKDRRLRFAKAQTLYALDNKAESVKLLEDLTREEYLPAIYYLAETLYSDETARARAIELYERYAALMPVDPRPHEMLGDLYTMEKNFERAEAAYRAAIARDQKEASRYDDLAGFLMRQSRFEEAIKAIDESVPHGGNAEEMFSDLIASCWDGEEEIAENLAASQPARMSKNAAANLQLGYLRLQRDQTAKALLSFKKALELKPDMVEAHSSISEAYRKLKNYRAALLSADKAIKLDAEDASGHYNRACALARLGRRAEAIFALKRAIELDEEYAVGLEEEEDLKPLSAMAEFRKLVEQGK